MAKPKKKEETEVAVVQPHSLVLEGDPEAQLDFAQKAASALMKRVQSKEKQVTINGKQYLEFGDWQTLARFFGSTVGVEWTKRIERDGKYVGYEARAIVYQKGIIIASAEASCLTNERNWSNRDEYAVKSMAQTRASAKALRNGFGWVAEMAGYSATPAEEMPRDMYDTGAVIDASGSEPTIVTDEPEDERRILFNLLKERGVDVSSKKACEQYVADTTELALVTKNYGAIIKKLKPLNI